jgi:flotillin
METLLALVAGGIGGIVLLSVIAVVATYFLYICEPNEIIVFSGRRRTLEDGTSVGYRVLTGGRALRWPILEKAERMNASNLAIDIRTTNAYSKGGIPLDVHAVANVKISKDPGIIGNSIERFLGRDISEVHQVAKETLEGHLRGVLATLTPEEVNEDRLKFAGALVHEADEDFHRLGLHLDTLKIQAVSDEVNYLASIGRKQIALVLQAAEIAEATNLSEAEQAEASARRKGEVAMSEAHGRILQAENEVKKAKADLHAEACREEETTIQAARQARAEAEQELQEIRRRLEEFRLQADVVLPAQAAQSAAALRARGDASYTEEAGRAQAYVLQLMTDAWLKAGNDARDIFLIQNLEQVLLTVVERVRSLKVDEVTLLDGGDGSALPAYVSSYPAMVGDVLQELERSTGVDVVGILTRAGQMAGQEA